MFKGLGIFPSAGRLSFEVFTNSLSASLRVFYILFYTRRYPIYSFCFVILFSFSSSCCCYTVSLCCDIVTSRTLHQGKKKEQRSREKESLCLYPLYFSQDDKTNYQHSKQRVNKNTNRSELCYIFFYFFRLNLQNNLTEETEMERSLC